MSRVKLRAEARFFHDKRLLTRGALFDAEERDARDLVALRFATRVLDTRPKNPAAEAATVSVEGAPDAPSQPRRRSGRIPQSEGGARQKRRYKRRDMIAEE
jgi:hypothetical protein